MKQQQNNPGQNSFLFQVEILVNAETNGAALERLLHVLNAGSFADYRVISGVQLGQAIEAALAGAEENPARHPAPSDSEKSKMTAALARSKAAAAAPAKPQNAPSPKQAPAASPGPSDELQQRVRQYIETNKLIRLNVNKGRGVKLSIPCRIISYDAGNQLLTVYHVDEKQVHNLNLFEIDDFVE